MAFGHQRVLDDVTFAVPKREAVAVIGPNGSGKTVLFKALVGSIPIAGRVRWAAGTRLGYVPQKLDLERDLPLTGLDLLEAKAHVTRSRGEVAGALERVGLSGAAAKPIGTLSGGQFQRLLLALALLGRPTALLLDEPTASVDLPGQENLNELVRAVQQERGLTVLVISHDLSVVNRYADDVLCLARERAWFGPPREVLTPEVLRQLYGAPVRFHVHGA